MTLAGGQGRVVSLNMADGETRQLVPAAGRWQRVLLAAAADAAATLDLAIDQGPLMRVPVFVAATATWSMTPLWLGPGQVLWATAASALQVGAIVIMPPAQKQNAAKLLTRVFRFDDTSSETQLVGPAAYWRKATITPQTNNVRTNLGFRRDDVGTNRGFPIVRPTTVVGGGGGGGLFAVEVPIPPGERLWAMSDATSVCSGCVAPVVGNYYG